jgi:hypothetical protein
MQKFMYLELGKRISKGTGYPFNFGLSNESLLDDDEISVINLQLNHVSE